MESVTIVFLHLYLIHEAIKNEGRTSVLARECAFGRTSKVNFIKKSCDYRIGTVVDENNLMIVMSQELMASLANAAVNYH